MNKIKFNQEDINDIINMYCVDILSTRVISNKFKVDSGVIRRVLKENNVDLRNSGRVSLGGKKMSDKRWRENNPYYISENHKNWSKENREHLRKYHREWRKNNIDHHRETKSKYERTRKSIDPIYKLIGNFRTAIYTVLKENNISKNTHYFEMLGYTAEELRIHLESQLTDGMTWENYGKWHVDHKLPITSFTFNDVTDDEFKKCWSLDNLQPMWGDENIRKSNKI